MGRIKEFEDEQVLVSRGAANRCYVFEFLAQDGDSLESFSFDTGNGVTTSQTPIPLDSNNAAAIKNALTSSGWFDVDSKVTFDLIRVAVAIDTLGNHWVITFKNPKLNGSNTDIGVMSYSGNAMLSTLTNCN